jgi:hypothetical protein
MEKPTDASGPKQYKVLIDQRPHQWGSRTILGEELKELAGVDANSYDVYLESNKGEDREISNKESVDLTAPGVEKFFTAKSSSTEGKK